MSSAGIQNLLMFCGAIAVMVSFWLLLAGFLNSSAQQFAGGVVTAAIAASCFRAYAAALRADRQRRGGDT